MRKDAQQNQQEILNCAKQLFTEKGVAHVSMNAIAKTLGIGAGTLYRHYPNKSALCMALAYGDLEAFVQKSNQYLKNNHDNPRFHFQQLLKQYLQFREANLELLINVDAGSETNQGSYFYASDLYQSVVAVFSQALQSALPNYPAETIQFRADMLIAMLKSDSFAYQRQVRKFDQKKLIAEITALFLN